MQIINIFPLGNLGMEYTQPMHMFLTHMIEKYPMYANTARDIGGYKILDNSLIELGDAVDLGRVLAAAEKIHADEIILPDVFQDGPATVKAVKEALQYLTEKWPNRNWPFKLMAVAHGKDTEEWHECYKELMAMPDIDVLGIPKVCSKMHPKGRPFFVNEMCNLYEKPHHLLGMWYSFTELAEYENSEQIRSCDTVLLGFMAKYGLHYMGVRPDGFTVDLENDVIDYGCLNLETKVIQGVHTGFDAKCSKEVWR